MLMRVGGKRKRADLLLGLFKTCKIMLFAKYITLCLKVIGGMAFKKDLNNLNCFFLFLEFS